MRVRTYKSRIHATCAAGLLRLNNNRAPLNQTIGGHAQPCAELSRTFIIRF